MKTAETPRAADGRIILDRAFIENKQKKAFKTTLIITIFLFVLLGIPMVLLGVFASSWIFLAFFFLIFVLIGVSIFLQAVQMRAVREGNYTLNADFVSRKYSSTDSDDHTNYYLIGVDSGKYKVDALDYGKIQQGEQFWYVLVNGKKTVSFGALPSSCYVLSNDLAGSVRNRPTAGPGVFDGSPSCTADSAPVPTAPYTAANDHKVTSHYGESHGKVRCASCGKKFDCHKHGDTCPKCGAVRVK